MKNSILTAVFMVLTAALYAATGTASISPGYLLTTSYHPVITITYSPLAGSGGITDGSVEVQIPSAFTPAPSTSTSGSLVSVQEVVSGVTQTVSSSNISINGYLVTINGISLASTDQLIITYGSSGSGWVYSPTTPGSYPFIMSEKTSGTASFTQLDSSPVLYVTNMTINKSCSISVTNTAKAGNTFTYYISYLNNDTGNMSGVAITDIMPQGVSFVSSTPAFTSNAGSTYQWYLGGVNPSAGNSITITAVGTANFAQYGLTSINTASISGTGTSGTNGMSVSKTVAVQGMILQPSISVPSSAVTGSTITVFFTMLNSGNGPAVSVGPSVMSAVPAAGMTPVSTPNPMSIPTLTPNSSYTFTWTFLASSAGTFSFSSHVYADDNTAPFQSPYYSSNNIVITVPTPTSTRTPAFTVTPTDTPTPIVTPTSTSTPAVNATATAIPTSGVTPAKTPTPANTPADKVYTDRNYINTGRGEQVNINYKVERDGETSVRIFNLNGDRVKEFGHLTLKAGSYTALWDGTNDSGRTVGKGIYFIVVKQPGGQTIRKLVVIK